MKKVGLTGGIGTGKTTVAQIFEIIGIPVFYADIEAKNITNDDEIVKKLIVENFGNVYSNNVLDRRKLAEIVFNDTEKLKTLNSIVHPALERKFENWTLGFTNFDFVIMEAAILFETGLFKKFDKIITVDAPLNIRINRVCKRDGVEEKKVMERIKNQISQEEKLKLSDFVVINDDNMMIISQVLDIVKKLKN